MAARPLHEAWRRADHPLDRPVDRPPRRRVGPELRRAAHPAPPRWSPSRPDAVRYPELANEFTLGVPRPDPPGAAAGAPGCTPPSEFVRGEVIDAFGADPDRVVAIHHGVDAAAPGPATPAAGGRWPAATATCSPSAPSSPARTCRPSSGRSTRWRPTTPTCASSSPGPTAGAPRRSRPPSAAAAPPRPHRAARLGRRAAPGRPPGRAPPSTPYPSVYEGFGLPAARGHGAPACPVVATRAGALPEVCRDGADLVEPGDADGLAAALGPGPRRRRPPGRARRRGRRVRPATTGTRRPTALAALFARGGRRPHGDRAVTGRDPVHGAARSTTYHDRP